MALCTKAEIKSFLVIPDSDTNRDTLIDALIPRAQNWLEYICNRIFEQAAVTEYHHGGSDRIFVRRPPMATSPAPVIYEDPDRTFDSSTLVASSDYYVGEGSDDGTIFFFYELQKGYGSVKVSYTGGFATIPGAANQACIELVARKLKTGPTGDIGLISKGTPGGVQINFSLADLLPETRLELSLLRLENVG